MKIYYWNYFYFLIKLMQYLFENKDKGKTHIKNIMELLVKLKNLIAEKINLFHSPDSESCLCALFGI